MTTHTTGGARPMPTVAARYAHLIEPDGEVILTDEHVDAVVGDVPTIEGNAIEIPERRRPSILGFLRFAALAAIVGAGATALVDVVGAYVSAGNVVEGAFAIALLIGVLSIVAGLVCLALAALVGGVNAIAGRVP